MNGIIQTNNNSLVDIVNRLTPKKKRLIATEATEKVKKSVKGSSKSITTEQGFRNYVKYTDPMLQFSDETTDVSKIASDLTEILSVFNKTNNVYDLQKDVVNKEEIKAEIVPDKFLSALPLLKNSATTIQGAVRGHLAKKEVKARREEIENEKSANTIQGAFRGHLAKKEVKARKEEIVEEKKNEIRRKIVRNRFAQNTKDLYEAYRDGIAKNHTTGENRAKIYTAFTNEDGNFDLKLNNKTKSAKILQGVIKRTISKKPEYRFDPDNKLPQGKKLDRRYFNGRPLQKGISKDDSSLSSAKTQSNLKRRSSLRK